MRPKHRDQIPALASNVAERAVLDCTEEPRERANVPTGGLRAICGYHYRRIISGRLHGWHPKCVQRTPAERLPSAPRPSY